MIDFAAVASCLARIRNASIPRIVAVCAVGAAIAGAAGGGWGGVAYADGGADAREQEATADEMDSAIEGYARRILRALADDDANEWVRYWRARADCEGAAAREGAAPMERVLLGLTGMVCARLEARLGVDPEDYPPRGREERTGGLEAIESGMAVGYTLFRAGGSKYAYLIDPLGRIAHSWQDTFSNGTFYHAKLLDNGNLLNIKHDSVLEFDPRGNVVWQYKPGGQLHHDFLKMPNGNVMLLVRGIKTREEAIAAGANPEFVNESGIKYDYLIEARPTGASGGEVVWEWSAWDHLVQDFDPSKPNYGAIAEHPELIDINFSLEQTSASRSRAPNDWTHVNAIDYNPELDQIMLSPRHFSELWIIDRSATTEEARGHSGGNSGMGGDLLYRWGNPRAYGHGTLADQRLFYQHQTHWIPPGLPGAGNILVFNNGNEFAGYERFYSSIDELAPPVDGYRYRRAPNSAYPPSDLAWTYVAETPTDFYAASLSGTQRLPNGNTLIADGIAGDIFQVTHDGKVAWKYVVPLHYHISLWHDKGAPARLTYGLPNELPFTIRTIKQNSLYRASWYPPDHPGLLALGLAPGAYLEDYPDLIDWARAAVLAGDFGEPIADSDFDIYLDENILIYFKQPCADEDVQAQFFLDIIPADARDLPAHRQERGFVNRGFLFGDRGKTSDGWCLAIAPLPRYPIERVSTGQRADEGVAWRAEVELGGE